MTVRAAVEQACDELGFRTSVTEVWRRASTIAGEMLNKASVQQYRWNYKKAKRVKIDCRTYKGQPRRNMLNDAVATVAQVKRIKHLLSLRRVLPESILNLLGDFHSIDQLRNAVSDLIELRNAA